MTVDLVVEAFGEELTRYALNLASLDSNLTQAQTDAILQLQGISSDIVREPIATNKSLLRRRFIVYTYGGPQEMGNITRIRAACGSPPPVDDEQDVIKRLLNRLIYEMYPLMLIDEVAVDDPFSRHVSAIFAFRCAVDLARRLLEDDDLSKLFPGDWGNPTSAEELCNVLTTMTWLSGSSRSEQLVSIPESLARFVLDLGTIHGARDYHDFLPFASLAVDKARQLAVGQAVAIPLVIGLSNVTLPQGVSVTLGGGRARGAEARTALILRGARSGPSSVIAAIDVSERLLNVQRGVSVGGQLASHLDIIATRSEVTWESINRCTYAFVLASTEGRIFAPQLDGYTELHPISSGPSEFVSYRSPSTFQLMELTQDDARRVETRFREVHSRHPASMNTTLKRIVSAATKRNDAYDAFIDAVMCWENMFSDSPETTFKVCASLAVLLEPENVTDRARVFKRLKQLYAARSNLVHGGSEPKIEVAIEMKNEAVWIAIRAARLVYQRDDLCECKDAAARHQRILVGV